MQERAQTPEPADQPPTRPAAYAQWDRAVPRPWWRRHPGFVILAAFAIAAAAFIATRPNTPATSTATVASPAQTLADLDGDNTPTTQYQAALGLLAPKCTQDQSGIAALANAGYQDLVKYGITDETRLTVLQHLNASVPAGAPRMDCAAILSAYLMLREG